EVAEQLEKVVGVAVVAVDATRLAAGGAARRNAGAADHDPRQQRRLGAGADVSGEAQRGRIEAIAGRSMVLKKAGPVAANVHHNGGREGVDVVQRHPLVLAVKKPARAQGAQIIILAARRGSTESVAVPKIGGQLVLVAEAEIDAAQLVVVAVGYDP